MFFVVGFEDIECARFDMSMQARQDEDSDGGVDVGVDDGGVRREMVETYKGTTYLSQKN